MAKNNEPKVLYEELTPHEFRERIAEAPIAYLPLGTLEWHGEHLPLGVDGLVPGGFFRRLSAEVGGIVLPMLFLGPDLSGVRGGQDLYGMDFWRKERTPLERAQLDGSAYWVPEEAFRLILESILAQLRRAGFRIVVAHGHGPSNIFFTKHSAEWKERFGLRCFGCWGGEEEKVGLGLMLDHAGVNETSCVMAVRPDLVQFDRLSAHPNEWPMSAGSPNPAAHSSAETGLRAIEAQLRRMTGILRDALTELRTVETALKGPDRQTQTVETEYA